MLLDIYPLFTYYIYHYISNRGRDGGIFERPDWSLEEWELTFFPLT